jgi:cytochrome P450
VIEVRDIAAPKHKADPFPWYQRLREESPVHRMRLPNGQNAWLVTRYNDVVSALKSERFVKNRMMALGRGELEKQPWMPKMFEPLTRNMLDLDPPDHTRLRAVVQKAFTTSMVESMRARIQQLTDRLLAESAHLREVDLIRDYALLIPTTIIAEMIGVPADDRHRFQRWSSAIVAANTTMGMVRALPRVLQFMRYIRSIVALRRAQPAQDLLTALVNAEETGDRLSQDELVAMVFLLLVAGHETTVNLIGNGTLALLENPEQLTRLREDPSLIKTGIEELLRFAGPLETATERFTREPVTIAEQVIPAGELVFLCLASANRDPTQFEQPDMLDLTRSPNRHVAFGFGIHYCLGAPLARLEAQIAIGTLVRRAQGLALAAPVYQLRWRKGLVLRGLKRLPVRLHEVTKLHAVESYSRGAR